MDNSIILVDISNFAQINVDMKEPAEAIVNEATGSNSPVYDITTEKLGETK